MAKRSIWKKITMLFVGLFALIIVGLFVLLINLDSIIGGGIEKFGGAATGTEVKIKNVSLSLLSGNLSLDGLVVKNPPGFVNPDAFKFTKFAVDLDLGSLATDTIVVNSIVLKDIGIDYEPNTGGSNLDRIQKNIEEYTGGKAQPKQQTTPAEKQPAQPTASGKKQKKVIIKKLVIDGAEITFANPLLGRGVKVKMPRFEMHNIGGGGNKSAAQVCSDIMNELIPAIAKATADSTGSVAKDIGKVGDNLGKSVKTEFKTIKSLFKLKK